MEKIASFTVDHLRLVPGVYVSRIDQAGGNPITTFDLRMTSPNDEPVMNTAEVHTIEHLAATFLRNHAEYADKTIYFGPMGCRTGFYFLVRDSISPEKAINIVYDAFCFIADFDGTIPGSERKECGNYVAHDLVAAKKYAKDMLPILRDWTVEKLVYPR